MGELAKASEKRSEGDFGRWGISIKYPKGANGEITKVILELRKFMEINLSEATLENKIYEGSFKITKVILKPRKDTKVGLSVF